MFTLINFIIYVVLAIIARAIGTYMISYLYVLAVLIPGLAVAVRDFTIPVAALGGSSSIWFPLLAP